MPPSRHGGYTSTTHRGGAINRLCIHRGRNLTAGRLTTRHQGGSPRIQCHTVTIRSGVLHGELRLVGFTGAIGTPGAALNDVVETGLGASQADDGLPWVFGEVLTVNLTLTQPVEGDG